VNTLRSSDVLIAAGITFTCLHRWNDFYVNKKGERVDLGKAPKGRNWQKRAALVVPTKRVGTTRAAAMSALTVVICPTV